MSPDLWERVAALYQSACELTPVERGAFLGEACRGDDKLRLEVESLLRQDVADDGVLEKVALEARSTKLINEARLPEVIGGYHIVRLIGEGGMGAVYEAVQLHPERRVALKVIRSGCASPELLRRFEQESQVLARLQHPGIGHVYEAGVAETSFGTQPFFAMEFIHGVSLIEYSSARNLSPKQRIELTAKVCEAVDHAHQRGIVHRDLKPANILVDERGQPKVVDFGVARVMDSDAPNTRQTSLGELVGTLAYMSPEQTLGDGRGVDSRSDVYALGVVLYELLAGRLPYQVGRRLWDAVRTVCEEDPAPLGTVNRSYRGDLEIIVGKALEKDKTRRYQSAADLALDLRHYLADKPILAKRATASYQFRKFVKRYKLLVTSLVAVFVILVAGIVTSTWSAVRATEEKRRADTQAATAKAVVDFLQNDLLLQAGASAQSGSDSKPDPDLKVHTALDRAAARIAGKFGSQPAVEVSIRRTIGNAYTDLSLYPQAQKQLEIALDLWRRRVRDSDRTAEFDIMNDLGTAYLDGARYGAAELVLNQALEGEGTAGGYRRATLVSMNALARTVEGQGDHTRAQAILLKVVDGYRRAFGDEDPDTLGVMNNLATSYSNLEKHAQAEELYRRVVDIKRRVLGAQHPSTILSVNSLAVQYRFQGKYSQAEPLLVDVLRIRRAARGEGHEDTLISMNSLGLLYQAQNRYAEAEPLLIKSLEATRRAMGDEHPRTLVSLFNLAELYRREGKNREAELLFRNVLTARRRVLGPDHPNTTNTLASLGAMKFEEGHYADAEPLLREALNSYEKKHSDSWRRYQTQNMLGASLSSQGKHDEAMPLLLAGYEGLDKRRESIPFENRSVLNDARRSILQDYQSLGKPEEAAVWGKANPPTQ